MIALVCWLILPIKSPGLMLNVAGSMSTNTGRAPSRQTAPAVAKNVKLGRITSSPAPMPSAISGNSSASLPDAQPMACSVPQYAATADSSLRAGRAVDERAAAADFGHRSVDLFAQAAVLARDVEHGNGGKRATYFEQRQLEWRTWIVSPRRI